MSIALDQIGKTTTAGRRRTMPAGHYQGVSVVALLATFLTQLVAALTLVLMWYTWQDPRNLAWPDNDRLILMSLTLLTVWGVSLALATRFRRRKAAERETFRQIWWSGGAVAGGWFGLPMYMSVTWDHLIYGGHDPATIITVGLIFMGVGAMLGAVLAIFSEPLVYLAYDRFRNRAAQRNSNRPAWLGWSLTPFTLVPGVVVGWSLLMLGPAPVSDPAYPGAVVIASNRSLAYGCLATLETYQTGDDTARVLDYYRRLAVPHHYQKVSLPGQLQSAALVPTEIAQTVPDTTSLAVVRYSNTPFQSSAESLDPAVDGCRSIRVYLAPAKNSGTLIQIVRERPAHIH